MITEIDALYPRFKWLVPGKLAGAPHPELYGGLSALAPILLQQGVGAIVTLSDQALEPDPERLGFHYLFVQTPDFRPPPNLQEVLSFIEAQVEQARGVLVHCFAGIGRTGTILAAWQMQQDHSLSAMQAVDSVRDQYIPAYARSRFPEHPSQFAALEEFARTR